MTCKMGAGLQEEPMGVRSATATRERELEAVKDRMFAAEKVAHKTARKLKTRIDR